MTRASWMWMVLVLVALAAPAEAATGPPVFSGASQVIGWVVDFFTGPVARGVAFVGLVVGLAILVLGDGRGGAMKVGLALVAVGLLGAVGTIVSLLLGGAGATF